jgi:carbonic anhydrase
MAKGDGLLTDRYGRPKIRSGNQQSVVASVVESAAEVLRSAQELVPKERANMKFDEAHPDVLVIQCSDGRYTSIVSELMQSNGVFRYDIMAMPGGPALLDMANASILQSEACRSGTSFLIKGHQTKRIWLLAHSGCGYYKYNLQGTPLQIIEDRQVSDLQRAASYLRSVNSNLQIYSTYIIQEKGLVKFKSIELE